VPDEEVFPVFRGDDELWWTDLPTSGDKKDVMVGRFGPGSLKFAVPSPGYPELEHEMNELMKNLSNRSSLFGAQLIAA
jgi:hypothetical protein